MARGLLAAEVLKEAGGKVPARPTRIASVRQGAEKTRVKIHSVRRQPDCVCQIRSRGKPSDEIVQPLSRTETETDRQWNKIHDRPAEWTQISWVHLQKELKNRKAGSVQIVQPLSRTETETDRQWNKIHDRPAEWTQISWVHLQKELKNRKAGSVPACLYREELHPMPLFIS